MRTIDLTEEFARIVKAARSTIEFKAAFWAWLDRERQDGPLAPLLSDMERHWSTVGQAPSLSEARDLLRQFPVESHAPRLGAIGDRFREVAGTLPAIDVVLLAGLERPEGYSRFDRGRNTIFIGLDHPSALAFFDHLELIVSHELVHAVRDPEPAVLADYGGAASMTHDEFVARHPFREHLVSEALATSVSELAYPGRPDRRYVYFDEDAIQWCEQHRREIAERMLLALEREEPYRTFYAEGSVTPDSPDCCDYWFGLHLGRFALAREQAGRLLRLPSSAFLERFLQPFVDEFVRGERVTTTAAAEAPPHRELGLPDAEDALAGTALPASVRRAYDEYASLMARRPELARQHEQQFAETIDAMGLRYRGEAWDVHAFPLLLSAEEERHLRWATDGLLRLVERVIELYRSDREVRAFFALPRHLESLCRLEPGFRPHVMLGRLDSFWSGRRLRFLELNANGAAMWLLAEVLGEQALKLRGVDEILERHDAESSPLTSRILDGLLSAWQQARNVSSQPRRIAIVDWDDLPTASEIRFLAKAFTRMGVETEFLSPRRLTFDGRELRGPNGPIDVVYRRLTTLDLLDRHAELRPLFDAARAGAVVTVGSYGSDVAHSKRLFAFLTHERWQRRLSPAERALIDAHVPWTRMMWPGKVQFEGRMRDIRELALEERERMVLKPSEGFEGRGVLLGAETAPQVWEAEVNRRLGGDHVLQERVNAPLRRMLVPHGRRVEEVSRWMHLGEFFIDGQLAGFLARVSQELVLSADSHERTLPCLVLADDEGEIQDQDLGPASP